MPIMNWLTRVFSKNKANIDMAQFTPVPSQGYLVGGALRDALLGRPFQDIDWLVVEPEQAAKEAAKLLGGSAFPLDEVRGHWRVIAANSTRDYAPIGSSLEENLLLRDFSVNAIAANKQGRLIDPVNGQTDLKNKILRMVSHKNLLADPLRSLRALRLATQLGFKIEEATTQAIAAHAKEQQEGQAPLPAWERVNEELNRLLLNARSACGIRLLNQLGLLDVYLPELALSRGIGQGGFHHLDVLEHSVEALHRLTQGFPDADLALRWATLLHDIGKPACKTLDDRGNYYHFYGHDRLGSDMTKTMLRRLHQSSEQIKRVSQLVRYHMLPLPKNRKEARRFVHRRREILPDLLKLMIADREAARGPLSSEENRRAYRLALGRILEIMSEAPAKQPLLSGHEVMALLNLSPSPQVGQALRFISEAEAVGDIKNKAEAAKALKNYARKQGWLN